MGKVLVNAVKAIKSTLTIKYIKKNIWQFLTALQELSIFHKVFQNSYHSLYNINRSLLINKPLVV